MKCVGRLGNHVLEVLLLSIGEVKMRKKTVRVRMMGPMRAYTRDAAPRSRGGILSAPTLGSRKEREFNTRTGLVIGLDPVWFGTATGRRN
jgi:hypothetical protein